MFFARIDMCVLTYMQYCLNIPANNTAKRFADSSAGIKYLLLKSANLLALLLLV